MSVIVGYSFEKLIVQIALRDLKTGNIIATERIASLEDIETSETTDLSKTSPITSQTADMLSFLELPTIQQGDYDLELTFLEAFFLTNPSSSSSKASHTCLDFDLNVEYVSRGSRLGGGVNQVQQLQ